MWYNVHDCKNNIVELVALITTVKQNPRFCSSVGCYTAIPKVDIHTRPFEVK